MSPLRSDSSASDSTTVSEFFRMRYRGEIPIFGGNPVTGARELVGAGVTSVQQIELTKAISSLTDVVKNMANPNRRFEHSAQTDDGPIVLIDKISDDLGPAATISDEKLQLMLRASALEVGDVQKYFTLLRIARESIVKEKAHREVHALRKANRDRSIPSVPLAEYDPDVVKMVTGQVNTFFELQLDESVMRPFVAALTHESMTKGRETNRSWALLGDALLQMMLKRRGTLQSKSVSEMSDDVQSTQSNAAIRDAGLKSGVSALVRSGINIDRASRSVLATVVEALYGASYVVGGEFLMMKINDKLKVLDVEGGSYQVSDYPVVMTNDAKDAEEICAKTRDILERIKSSESQNVAGRTDAAEYGSEGCESPPYEACYSHFDKPQLITQETYDKFVEMHRPSHEGFEEIRVDLKDLATEEGLRLRRPVIEDVD